MTAAELGDTVAVTRSAYVHPGVLEAFDAEAPASGGRRGRRDLVGPPDRQTELEVLALLRRANAARRSQVGGAAGAHRSRLRRT